MSVIAASTSIAKSGSDFRDSCGIMASFIHENLTNSEVVPLSREEVYAALLRLSHCSHESIIKTSIEIGASPQ